mmetsp:Transcript_4945/g.13388  ORF Transcript_4945/g.13388 Transcript_4945/m.13388 type:complete len:219 (-) Transcript_4945:1755-2411(-)
MVLGQPHTTIKGREGSTKTAFLASCRSATRAMPPLMALWGLLHEASDTADTADREALSSLLSCGPGAKEVAFVALLLRRCLSLSLSLSLSFSLFLSSSSSSRLSLGRRSLSRRLARTRSRIASRSSSSPRSSLGRSRRSSRRSSCRSSRSSSRWRLRSSSFLSSSLSRRPRSLSLTLSPPASLSASRACRSRLSASFGLSSFCRSCVRRSSLSRWSSS